MHAKDRALSSTGGSGARSAGERASVRPGASGACAGSAGAGASASTSASGAGARSAAAGASATTSALGATAGSARAKHLRAQAQEEPLPGVRGRGPVRAPAREEQVQDSAARTRLSRCQMGWRSSGRATWAVVMRSEREESQSSVAPHSREELRSRWRGAGRVENFKNRV